MKRYYTNKIAMDVLPKGIVRIANIDGTGKVYLLDGVRLYILLVEGGKKVNIPEINGGYVAMSFNVERKHISNAGSTINTYLNPVDYVSLIEDLRLSIRRGGSWNG